MSGPAQLGTRPDLVRQVRVTRHGIHDARRQLVAYRAVVSAGAPGSNGFPSTAHPTTAQVAATFGAFGVDGLTDGRPLFVDLPRPFLTGIVPVPVEPASVVVELGEHTGADAELLLALNRMQQAGYRIAVADYRGDASRSALLELADFVTLRVDSLPSLVVPGLVQTCRARGATLIATGIDDAAAFAHCVELGFDLFEGRYLMRPATLERSALTP